MMIMVWDERKRVVNLAKDGMDFAALTVEFFLGSMVVPARDGRSMAIGRLAPDVITGPGWQSRINEALKMAKP